MSAPINTRVSARELGYLLEDAAPECLVTEAAFEDLLAETDNDLAAGNTYVADSDVGGSYDDLFADEVLPSAEPGSSDTASLLYTSGTTGHPKGCLAEHFHLVNGAVNYRQSFDTQVGVRSLVNVPLFHVAGLMANLLHTVGNVGTTVILNGAGPETFLWTIQDESVEFVLSVPTHYILAMERADPSAYDLSSWEVAGYGGAPMAAESIARLRRALPDVALCDAYGTTETAGGLVTMCPDEYTDDQAHTIGIPTPPMELAVVDDDRRPFGPDTVGELAIRGPIVVDHFERAFEEVGPNVTEETRTEYELIERRFRHQRPTQDSTDTAGRPSAEGGASGGDSEATDS